MGKKTKKVKRASKKKAKKKSKKAPPNVIKPPGEEKVYTLDDVMTEDSMAFIMTVGGQTISFLQSETAFFVTDGPRFVISPVNRVEKVKVKGDEAEFTLGNGSKLKVDLLEPSGSLEEFTARILEQWKERKRRGIRFELGVCN